MEYPILMADVIHSGKQDSRKLLKEFKSLAKALNVKWKANLRSPLTITLGDEFQGIIDSIENGIKLIFDCEELIIQKGFDLKFRYVLNYGKIDTKINPKIAYGMMGEGLTQARNSLNNLKNEDWRFLLKTGVNPPSEKEAAANKAFSIYQSFIDDWKPKDLKTVSAFLHYQDYKKVAEIIHTDKSSAWRRKKSLKINEFISIKELILVLLK